MRINLRMLQRNGTLNEVHTIHTGMKGMHEFGLLDRLNGDTKLPYWNDAPCNALQASEGSFFPPRYFTKKDLLHIYDKDLCRIMPLQYRGPMTKHGISVDMYTPPDTMFESVDKYPDNKCYCPGNEFCPPKGLQNISPCQFGTYLDNCCFHFVIISWLQMLPFIYPSHTSWMLIRNSSMVSKALTLTGRSTSRILKYNQ